MVLLHRRDSKASGQAMFAVAPTISRVGCRPNWVGNVVQCVSKMKAVSVVIYCVAAVSPLSTTCSRYCCKLPMDARKPMGRLTQKNGAHPVLHSTCISTQEDSPQSRAIESIETLLSRAIALRGATRAANGSASASASPLASRMVTNPVSLAGIA